MPPGQPSELNQPRISAPSSKRVYIPPLAFQLSPPPPINGPHGAHRRVVKRLWVEGQRRGISATEMPGFDSRSAKQNFPQESQEGFRNRLPPLDRRGALGGELFGGCCSFLECFSSVLFFAYLIFLESQLIPSTDCEFVIQLPQQYPTFISSPLAAEPCRRL